MDTTLKYFLFCSAGNLVVRAIAGLTVPITLRWLDPAEYGLLSLILSGIAVVTPILGLGLRQFLAIEYFHCTGNARCLLVSRTVMTYLVCSVPLLVFMSIGWYASGHSIGLMTLCVALGITFFSFFVELLYQLWRYEQQILPLIAIQCASAVIMGLSTVFFLGYTNLGIISVLLSQLIGQSITCACGLAWYARGDVSFFLMTQLDIHTIVYMVRKGILFIPNMLFAWILASSDRWFLARYCTLADIGMYAVADMCCQLFQTLVLNAWAASYLPMMLAAYQNEPDRLLQIEQKNFVWMSICLSFGCVGVIIGVMYASPVLMRILPAAYHPAISYIWILLAGQIALLGTYFASTLIQFQKKQLFLSCGLLIPAGINIVLNALLIPYFGLFGCTVATLSSYCIYFAITLCYNLFIQRQIRQRSRYEANVSLHSPVYYNVSHSQTNSTKSSDKMAQL